MEFEMPPYIVYVKPNESGYITSVNSSAFLTDTAGWIEIDSGYGDKYHHAQGNYFEKPIISIGGAFQYKMVDSEVVECTESEIVAQEIANKKIEQPTQLDRIEAQVAYLAMMTGNEEILEV